MTEAEYAVCLLRDFPETVPHRMVVQSFKRLVHGRSRQSGSNPGWLVATLNLQDAERVKSDTVKKAAWERARKAVARIAIGLPPETVN